MLRQDDKTPLYIQLKESIRSSILDGTWKYGDKIPTELELSERYNISRITVRNAILELVDEGYLVKKQGKGTFVNKKKIDRKIVHFLGFTEACKANGLTASSKVIKREIIQPTEKDKEMLQLEDGDALLYVQRVRYANDSPIMLENNYFSYRYYHFLQEKELEGSLYKTIEETIHVTPTRSGEISLEMVRASGEQTELLNVSSGEPLFYLETVIYDENESPVHIGRQFIIGEEYKFTLNNL
jgi:GntR family transcriptional regulator